MDIGEEKETIYIEPIERPGERPAPRERRPDESPMPPERAPEPAPTPA